MYRKFTADHIFNGYELLPAPMVIITDQSGTIIETVSAEDAGDEIERLEGLLTPGFVNAHCHLELSHLKGAIEENTGLVSFVQQVISNRGSNNELKLEAMERAAAEMYDTGIVAVGDICNTTDSIPVKITSPLRWHNFIEVSGFTPAAAQTRLDAAKKVQEQFKAMIPDKGTALSPHAPYSVSEKLFQLLNLETANQLITIHNQECAAENELYQDNEGGFLTLYKNFGIDHSSFEATGTTSFQSWLPYFTNHQSIISVHNSFTSAEDLAFFNNHQKDVGQFFYCICVNANKYIEQKIPPIGLLKKSNAAMVIGTDSYASNRQLNILEEIKTIQQENNFSISLQEILRWATINGAKALQMDDTIGSFERGKKPGIVLIEGLENLQTTPHSSSRRIL